MATEAERLIHQDETGVLLTPQQQRSMKRAPCDSPAMVLLRVAVPLAALLGTSLVFTRSAPTSGGAGAHQALRSAAQHLVGLAEDCHTTVEGESCYDEAKWAKTDGIFAHKSWYPGLTADSSIADFQASVHLAAPDKCPMPCGVAPARPAGPPTDDEWHVARFAPPPDTLREKCGATEDGIDFNVSAFETLYDIGGEHMCCSACAAYPKCKAWTWGKQRDTPWLTNICWLKELPLNGDIPRVTRASVVSGLPSPRVAKYGVVQPPASKSHLMDGVTQADAPLQQPGATAKCPGKLSVQGHGEVPLINTMANTASDSSAGSVSVVAGEMVVPHMDGRTYFGQTCAEGPYNNTDYAAINFLGKRISWTTDVSGLGCGCNAAVYLVSMRQNTDVGKCSDFYCDAMKVCGVACTEIDLQEANMYSWMSTLHAYSKDFGADTLGVARGYGGSIGEPPRRDFTADQYGLGATCVDTLKPFRVSVSFPVDGGGVLAGMHLELSQEGKPCNLYASIDAYDNPKWGGNPMADFTEALTAGMTPVVSYWKSKDMLWMDGIGADGRGPCVKDAPDVCPDHVRHLHFSIEPLDEALPRA